MRLSPLCSPASLSVPTSVIGGKLVLPPITESIVNTEIQAPVGTIDVQDTPDLASSHLDSVLALESDPPANHRPVV